MLRTVVAGFVVFTLVAFVKAEEIKDTPLPLKASRAFPQLRFRRPLVVTHPNDGTNRLFVVSQYGVIHVIPNDQSIAEAPTFLDIESRVVYKDK